MKWKEGRQGDGYRVLTLFSSKRFKCDLHLVVVPSGSGVPWHLDPATDGYEHHRVNLTLQRPAAGGETWIDSPTAISGIEHQTKRLYRFRPDLARHVVTPVRAGKLALLSFGWLAKL